MFAYDLFNLNINDPNISSKFVRSDQVRSRSLRNSRLINEPFYRSDYLRNQSIARLISITNTNSDIFIGSQSKESFRTKIEKKLTDIGETQDN